MKCDLDGVPFIVQSFNKLKNVYEDYDFFMIRLFNGRYVEIHELALFHGISYQIWRNATDNEIYELLENYIGENWKRLGLTKDS